MTGRDEYYNRAKQEGYRARSAYKLKQLDAEANLLDEGATVVDLGAAPGGWLQVASEAVGETGTVVGVDRQRIDALDGVDLVRGDMTDEDTKADLRAAVGGESTASDAADGGTVDTVLSDMAPNMTGEYDLDHARSIHLARQAFDVALDVLAPGGDLVVKVFDGSDLAELEADLDAEFEYVRQMRPDASRDSSSELYLVAKNHITAPVAEGDVLDVDVGDTGHEGDGIAKVEGFTLFVGGADEGETVTVRVEDVKPRFGFAEPVE